MKVLLLGFIALVMAGCVAPEDLHYLGPCGVSPSNPVLSTPQGFRVTPQDACNTVKRSRRLPLKHAWACYADSRYYYVHNAFWGTGAREALRIGVRIDGQTGKIVDRIVTKK